MVLSFRILRTFLTSQLGKGNFNRRLTFAADSQFSNYDLVVIGGGIIGTATAREIKQRNPELKIALLEKENAFAKHQSGHNGGVVHSGIYYMPGSDLAKLCVEGMQLLYEYCASKKIPYKKCGKLIVATNQNEMNSLLQWYNRAKENNVRGVEIIDGPKISEIEPICRGVKALWSPNTGCVDFAAVTRSLAKDFMTLGGDVFLNYEVCAFMDSVNDADYPVTVRGGRIEQKIKTRFVISCAGLESDVVAEFSGCPRVPKNVPCHCEYCLLKPTKCKKIKGHICAMPDLKNLSSLRPHLTSRMDGSILVGPQSILAFKRDGYQWTDIDRVDFSEKFSQPGLVKRMLNRIKFNPMDLAKSALTSEHLKFLQEFIPGIGMNDIAPGPSGVHAKTIDASGKFIVDLVLEHCEGPGIAKQILHCRNVPSPGATSALPIGKKIANKFKTEFTS